MMVVVVIQAVLFLTLISLTTYKFPYWKRVRCYACAAVSVDCMIDLLIGRQAFSDAVVMARYVHITQGGTTEIVNHATETVESAPRKENARERKNARGKM